MSRARPITARLWTWADSLLPDPRHAEDVQRTRVAVAQAALGIPFTLAMAVLYLAGGSPVSALALAPLAPGLAAVPALLRRGAKVAVVGNVVVALTFAATLVVALRTGGLGSPAVGWNILLPVAVYAVAGQRSALAWAALVAAQLVGLYAAERVGLPIRQDLGEPVRATLALVGQAGVLLATVALLALLEGARRAAARAEQEAERLHERQRILDDMHDGVGGQLLGRLVQARAGALHGADLIAELESCLDDLRIIVDSLDPDAASLEWALGGLRARLAARCAALGVELSFTVDADVAATFDAAEGVQVLRALQEMVTNSLRHAGTPRVEVRLGAADGTGKDGAPRVALTVRDHGVGLPADSAAPGRGSGRGMKSLTARARKLGGVLRVEPAAPGLRVTIERPQPPPRLRDGAAARAAVK
jgi:signal transduction histidine kinase